MADANEGNGHPEGGDVNANMQPLHIDIPEADDADLAGPAPIDLALQDLQNANVEDEEEDHGPAEAVDNLFPPQGMQPLLDHNANDPLDMPVLDPNVPDHNENQIPGHWDLYVPHARRLYRRLRGGDGGMPDHAGGRALGGARGPGIGLGNGPVFGLGYALGPGVQPPAQGAGRGNGPEFGPGNDPNQIPNGLGNGAMHGPEGRGYDFEPN